MDLIIGMITVVKIRRWHVTARRATCDSLLKALYKEALVINVLFSWLQYCTVCVKRRSERNRRELARIREKDARARRRKAPAEVSKAKYVYIH